MTWFIINIAVYRYTSSGLKQKILHLLHTLRPADLFYAQRQGASLGASKACCELAPAPKVDEGDMSVSLSNQLWLAFSHCLFFLLMFSNGRNMQRQCFLGAWAEALAVFFESVRPNDISFTSLSQWYPLHCLSCPPIRNLNGFNRGSSFQSGRYLSLSSLGYLYPSVCPPSCYLPEQTPQGLLSYP